MIPEYFTRRYGTDDYDSRSEATVKAGCFAPVLKFTDIAIEKAIGQAFPVKVRQSRMTLAAIMILAMI